MATLDKYFSLLVEASEKNSYGKTSIEKLNQNQKLQQSINKAKREKKLEKLNVYNKSSPIRQEISNAVIKAGKKAYASQIKLFDKKLETLKNKVSTLQQQGASPDIINRAQQELSNYLDNQQKKENLQKELQGLKNEPLEYMAKLQEINTLEKAQTSNIQTGELTEIKQLLKAQITPAQLLQADVEYQSLNTKEKALLMKELTKMTKRDIGSRKQVVLEYLNKTPQEKKLIIDAIKAAVPLKAVVSKAEASQIETSTEAITQKMADDVYRSQKYIDKDQAEYVLNGLNREIEQHLERRQLEPEITRELTTDNIREIIDFYKNRFIEDNPKPTDIIFEQAQAEADNNALIQSAENVALQDASKEQAVEEAIPIFNHPEDAAAVQAIKEELQVNDDLKPAEAQADAEEIVGAVNAELNITQSPIVEPLGLPEKKKKKKSKTTETPEKKKKSKKDKGEGFKPLTAFSADAVASGFNKHIDRVRRKRRQFNINANEIMKNTENQEYRRGLVKNVLNNKKLF